MLQSFKLLSLHIDSDIPSDRKLFDIKISIGALHCRFRKPLVYLQVEHSLAVDTESVSTIGDVLSAITSVMRRALYRFPFVPLLKIYNTVGVIRWATNVCFRQEGNLEFATRAGTGFETNEKMPKSACSTYVLLNYNKEVSGDFP